MRTHKHTKPSKASTLNNGRGAAHGARNEFNKKSIFTGIVPPAKCEGASAGPSRVTYHQQRDTPCS